MTTPNTDNTTPTPRYTNADIAAAVARALRKADDRPRPGPDAAHSSGKYANLAQNFRGSAWRHLDDGDLPQASNKAWGLVAETVKAIAAEHGGFIHKHRSISEVVLELARLPRDAGDADAARRIILAFRIASDQHANFYEDDLDDVVILAALMECEELSTRLYTLFWPAGAPDTDPATA